MILPAWSVYLPGVFPQEFSVTNEFRKKITVPLFMEFTYALRVADPRLRGGWPPSGRIWCFQLL